MQVSKPLLAFFAISTASFLFAQNVTPESTDSTVEKVKEVIDPLVNPTSKKSNSSSETGILTKDTIYVNSKVAFTLAANDEQSTVDYIEWRPKNGEYRKYVQPIRLSEEGLTEIQYRSVDKAGNVEAPKVLIILVDNTAPKVTLQPAETLFYIDGAPYASKNNSYTIVAEDKGSGIEKVEYNINNEANRNYSEPIKLEKGGANLIKFNATDRSQNQSPEASIIIIVDDMKPKVEIVPSVPLVDISGAPYAKRGAIFHVNAYDSESGIRKILVKVDAEEEFRPYVDGLNLQTQGEHKIWAKAVDNVGNESEIVELKFFVDLLPPASKIQKTEASE